MSAGPFIRYVVPSVLLGAVFGYSVGFVAPPGGKRTHDGKRDNPRASFLSSDDDEFDYDKIARVCLAASGRGKTLGPRGAAAVAASPEVDEAKGELDRIMSISLEQGVWSRGAAFRADTFLQQLPPSDVADFEKLVEGAIDRGDLKLQDGAWLPGEAK